MGNSSNNPRPYAISRNSETVGDTTTKLGRLEHTILIPISSIFFKFVEQGPRVKGVGNAVAPIFLKNRCSINNKIVSHM